MLFSDYSVQRKQEVISIVAFGVRRDKLPNNNSSLIFHISRIFQNVACRNRFTLGLEIKLNFCNAHMVLLLIPGSVRMALYMQGKTNSRRQTGACYILLLLLQDIQIPDVVSMPGCHAVVPMRYLTHSVSRHSSAALPYL